MSSNDSDSVFANLQWRIRDCANGGFVLGKGVAGGGQGAMPLNRRLSGVF